MNNFLSVKDAESIQKLVAEAREVKKAPLAERTLGKDRTLGLIFMNPSLRTRLSTQKAAMNLGMDVMVMNFTGEGWALETSDGTVMDGSTSEHINEAAAVIGRYCDIMGLRSFPKLKERDEDYRDQILGKFVERSGIPVVNLESATLHPLQSLADVMTIEEYKTVKKPKVVLTWAPHPRALPQSVGNSFAQWINKTDYEFVIAHPKGFELKEQFAGEAYVTNDPEEAYTDADFIYAKNWSSYSDYGAVRYPDDQWMVDEAKMALTNNAKFMHCLPVRRNVVVSDGVIDSDQSIVIDEAHNRLFAAQAVLRRLILDN
jgi:N-succinyl-L-ornithine transcarbamylase